MTYGTVQANAIQGSINNFSPNSAVFRNRIINGAMVIDQRNAGASVNGNNVYTLDRWYAQASQNNKFTVQQNAGSVTPPTGFRNYLGVTSSSAYTVGSGEQFNLLQGIEGFNTADLMWGTANAQTITLSFWVRSSLTGTFGGSLQNATQNRSYPFTYTISAANTWEQKSITITGDTSGTWNTTNGAGIYMWFGLGVGSSVSGTAGSWSGSNFTSATGATSVVGTNGATFYITGVQLEVGSTATSFDYRPYGTELALCQRYLFVIKGSENSDGYCRFSSGECISGAGYNSTFLLPVKMRATPVLTTTGTASNYAIYSRAVITACNAVPTIDAGNPQTIVLAATVASGLTTGSAAQLLANNNNTAYLYFGAEL
jgi:hypothetical protein